MPRDPRRVKVVPVCHEKGCRSYVVVDPHGRDAVVVDPLLDRVTEILRVLGEEGATLRWIVDTHSHGDHLSGAAALAERTGAEVVMHPDAPSEVATRRPGDGVLLPFGEHGLLVRHAPGNSPDALVLLSPGAVFTGDTLLIGTVGLRDVPGSDPRAWFETLHRIFDPLPETTVVHPGHDDMGRTMSSLRQERTGNAWLRQDDVEAFVATWEADARPVRKDAEALLEANRGGLTRVPRDLEAASGLSDPFHVTEAALRDRPALDRDPPAATAVLPDPTRTLMQITGAAAVLGTLLGWGLHVPLLHGLAGLAGAVLLGVSLPARRRRKAATPSDLFYEGPTRKTLTG